MGLFVLVGGFFYCVFGLVCCVCALGGFWLFFCLFFRECFLEGVTSKSSTGPLPHLVFSSIAMLLSFCTVNTDFEGLQGTHQ